jgi:hypothetical protein
VLGEVAGDEHGVGPRPERANRLDRGDQRRDGIAALPVRAQVGIAELREQKRRAILPTGSMGQGTSTPWGAAAGAAGVVLFAAGAVVIGERPGFEAGGAEIAANLDENRTRIQLGCAIQAAWTPLFVWFLATVGSIAEEAGPGARRAAAVAFGCGLVFNALFLVDLSALAVSALRPENMAANPELAVALRDFEWLTMGTAAFALAGTLAAFAALSLRHGAVWPRWLGLLAIVAALLYLLRVGTLFATDGAFAVGGVLGLYVPVAAAAGWVLIASVTLALVDRPREAR